MCLDKEAIYTLIYVSATETVVLLCCLGQFAIVSR